jgi:hypothetical protein
MALDRFVALHALGDEEVAAPSGKENDSSESFSLAIRVLKNDTFPGTLS